MNGNWLIWLFSPFSEEGCGNAELIMKAIFLFAILQQQERNIQSSEKSPNP